METDAYFSTAPLPIAPLDDPERLACLRLIRSDNVGPVAFRQLINHFGGAQTALEALPDLVRRGGSRRVRVCAADKAEAELEAAYLIGAQPIFTIEPGYPTPLAAIDPPPPMIYAKGRTELLNQPCIAIVGSRNCSSAGHAFARQLALGLADADLVVTSGLARGIDGAAHEASLENGTIAVIAGGLDIFYPPEHAKLQAQIADVGCLVTEMPPGFKPRAKDFPRRNRIISGISYGVIVVEAARRSGTLITARLANEQGREVFAAPGHPLDPRAEGTNRLIKSGATMITEIGDVLEVVQPMLPAAMRDSDEQCRPTPKPRDQPTTPVRTHATQEEHSVVVRALGPAPVHIDDLLRSTGLNAQSIQIALLELSLAGRLEHHGAHLVSLRFEG